MAQFEIRFEERDHRGRPAAVRGAKSLALTGPVLNVRVGIPQTLAKRLLEAGTPVPSPRTGLALIDTGATKTSIDSAIVSELNLPTTGRIKLITAGGPCDATLHALEVFFPAMGRGLSLPQAVSCNLSWSPNANPPGFAVLFGRDLLESFVMIYNGPRGVVTLIDG